MTDNASGPVLVKPKRAVADAAIAGRIGMAEFRWHVHPGGRVLARGLVTERRGAAARGPPKLGLTEQIAQRVPGPVDVARENHLICWGRQPAPMSGVSGLAALGLRRRHVPTTPALAPRPIFFLPMLCSGLVGSHSSARTCFAELTPATTLSTCFILRWLLLEPAATQSVLRPKTT